MPRLQQFRRQTRLLQSGIQPLREWSGFQPDAGQIETEALEPGDQSFRLARDLGLAHNPPGGIHHAQA